MFLPSDGLDERVSIDAWFMSATGSDKPKKNKKKIKTKSPTER
jgi:hypothetical protein